MSEVGLPLLLSNQVRILAHRARFKIVRAGRRFGKSRLALLAGLVGHGEGRWQGMLDGFLDIVWFTPDYPQSRAIWREEIKPRFSGVEGITLNESERRISVAGGGSLEIRSAEAIDGIRGRKLGGVIVDEARS